MSRGRTRDAADEALTIEWGSVSDGTTVSVVLLPQYVGPWRLYHWEGSAMWERPCSDGTVELGPSVPLDTP